MAHIKGMFNGVKLSTFLNDTGKEDGIESVVHRYSNSGHSVCKPQLCKFLMFLHIVIYNFIQSLMFKADLGMDQPHFP